MRANFQCLARRRDAMQGGRIERQAQAGVEVTRALPRGKERGRTSRSGMAAAATAIGQEARGSEGET